MAIKQNEFTTLGLTPLTGPLDARYNPTEVPDAGFVWKQNFCVSENGKLSRKLGVSRLFPAFQSGGIYTNFDLHQRPTGTRLPIVNQWQITKNDDTRQLFAADYGSIYVLNESTGLWTPVGTGFGQPGSTWSASVLQNTITFTNNVNDVQYLGIGGSSLNPITDLSGALGVSAARVTVQYQGFTLIMNVVQNGVRQGQRIIWSDLNSPLSYNPATGGSIAGFQDLNNGEQILAAAYLQGNIVIYTNQSIWLGSININPTTNTIFAFNQIYTDPKNLKACIAYPNTLVSTGTAHYWAGSDSWYTYNPYLIAPENPEWLRQATGLIYTNKSTIVDQTQCVNMCAEYRPLVDEIWISWQSQNETYGQGINDTTMVLSTKWLTGYYFDDGFSAFCNYQPMTDSGQPPCNVQQVFVAASSRDYSLKEIGDPGVFYREFVTDASGSPVTDNITSPVYTQVGYTSLLRGTIPDGLPNLTKLMNKITLGHYTAPQATPCVASLRIGVAFHAVNPNIASCDLVWHGPFTVPLACVETLTPAEMMSQNLIPSNDTHWDLWEQGQFLYFEISILNADGTPAIGADTHWHKLDFRLQALSV